jgi:sugar (pentulose or hexulose) kinase
MIAGRPGRGACDVCIGLDLGTSGLKGSGACLVGCDLRRGVRGLPAPRPGAGEYEQDVGDWLRGAEKKMAQQG